MSIEIDLVALKAAAEAATPGVWEHSRYGSVIAGPEQHYVNGSFKDQILMTTGASWMKKDENLDNATFIAAANPAVVLALIERLQVAEAKAKARVKLYISPKEYMPEQQLTAYRIYGAV